MMIFRNIQLTLNQLKMNEKELAAGVLGTKSSWHMEYKDSAWNFLGGLPYEMTEGDIICMFSQYGEPVRRVILSGFSSLKVYDAMLEFCVGRLWTIFLIFLIEFLLAGI